MELATALREPLTAEFSDKKDPLAWTVYYKKDTVSALLGEIFQEEERRLTSTYYAILKAIAEGKNNPKEIGDYVKSLGLISTNSVVTSYLRNLEDLKVVKRLRNAEKEEQRFIINSPLLDLYFYLDAKYGYSEVNVSLDKVVEVE
ncbi:MAG: hypothetical protein JZD40_00870, partial [Sulfolobus sp.]|nr:hypothetical protein [Sulfolobus sp.]